MTPRPTCATMISRLLATRRVFATGAMLFAFVAGLMAFEGAVRAFDLVEFDSTLDEPDPLFGWRHIPGAAAKTRVSGRTISIEMNSRGLRDKEIPYAKPQDTFRILLLGDSIVEGRQVPVHETFAKRLEVLLNEHARTGRYEVINAGVGGYGTDNELLFYRHEARRYAADLVILAFFVGNDVYDNSAELVPVGTPGKPLKPWFTLRDGELSLQDHPCACRSAVDTSAVGRTKRFLRQHSASYLLVRNSMTRVAPQAADLLVRAGAMSSLYRQKSYLVADGVPLAYMSLTATDAPAMRRAWELTGLLLAQLDEEARRDSASFAVVEVPIREQIYPDLWERALATHPAMKAQEWDLDKPERLLSDMLRRFAIRFLSATSALREGSRLANRRLYFDSPNEHHLTTDGHAVVADLLYSFLVEKSLLVVPATP